MTIKTIFYRLKQVYKLRILRKPFEIYVQPITKAPLQKEKFMYKKEKESKAFFEIFKKPQEQNKQSSFSKQGLGRHQNINDDNRKKEQLSWIKDTIGGKPFQAGTQKVKNALLNKVTVKQETLILGSLCAVFLSLACFFIGYKIGHSKALNLGMGIVKSIPPDKEVKAIDLSTKPSYLGNRPEQNKEVKTKDLSVKPSNIKNRTGENNAEKWTLQIITYSNTKQHMKNAADLAKAIKDMTGYNTFVVKRGNELVVCVGRFQSRNNVDIKTALNEISNILYEGKKQFANAYPVQIR